MTDVLDRLKAALSDRYTIERELGAGGMATVYLAHDVRHDRQVAVKVLRPDLAAPLGPDRFLHHPHILPLYDSGESDGFLYYVMPYEEGQSLRERLAREGELPITEAVRILREVVDALAHAHEHGVVHRDRAHPLGAQLARFLRSTTGSRIGFGGCCWGIQIGRAGANPEPVTGWLGLGKVSQEGEVRAPNKVRASGDAPLKSVRAAAPIADCVLSCLMIAPQNGRCPAGCEDCRI